MVRGSQSRWFAASSLACVAFACLACRKPAAAIDAGPDDGATAAAEAAAAPAPLAANEAAVTRYPDETAVNNVSQAVKWAVANVRTQASSTAGDAVATIKAGTDVTKIADHQSFSLVVFTDPTDPSKKDMGWVSNSVFSPPPAHTHVAAHCTGGQVAILLPAGDETCIKQCTDDSACPKGEVCNGSGVLSNNGAPGAATKFCGPKAGAVPTDAGAPPAAKLLDVHKEGGQCPVGYVACGPVMCRLQCTKDGDCGGAGAKCQGGTCLGAGKAACPK
jgi:hypothetical protein